MKAANRSTNCSNRRLRIRHAALLLLLGIMPALTGCLSFEQRWKEAAVQHVPKGSIAGRWTGHWTRDESDQRGRIRCILTLLKRGTYEARFQTKTLAVIPFERTVRFAPKLSGGLHHFEGEANLGWLTGGVYRFKGKIDATQCFATYASGRGSGAVELSRPG